MTTPTPFPEPVVAPSTVVVAESGLGLYGQQLLDGRHHLAADEPAAVGGNDFGPGPYELLLMALGSCTSMTLRMYAGRQGFALERVVVRLKHDRVYAKDCEECDAKPVMLDRIEREIDLIGALDDLQKARLMEIADKCPLHRTLTTGIKIVTRLATAQPTVAPLGGNV